MVSKDSILYLHVIKDIGVEVYNECGEHMWTYFTLREAIRELNANGYSSFRQYEVANE